MNPVFCFFSPQENISKMNPKPRFSKPIFSAASRGQLNWTEPIADTSKIAGFFYAFKCQWQSPRGGSITACGVQVALTGSFSFQLCQFSTLLPSGLSSALSTSQGTHNMHLVQSSSRPSDSLAPIPAHYGRRSQNNDQNPSRRACKHHQ